jgi:hypothetical protein
VVACEQGHGGKRAAEEDGEGDGVGGEEGGEGGCEDGGETEEGGCEVAVGEGPVLFVFGSAHCIRYIAKLYLGGYGKAEGKARWG